MSELFISFNYFALHELYLIMNNIKNKKITYFCGLASSLLSPSFSSMNKVTELPPLHQFPSIAKKKKKKTPLSPRL